jgi:hypothetical protein
MSPRSDALSPISVQPLRAMMPAAVSVEVQISLYPKRAAASSMAATRAVPTPCRRRAGSTTIAASHGPGARSLPTESLRSDAVPVSVPAASRAIRA